MVNPEELEKLFEDGYRVVISYPLLNHTPQEINGFVSFFKTKLSLKEALHPTNRNKNVVVLSLPTGHQVEVLTSDEAILNRINKRLEYQKEPIGMIILARCLATGGRSAYGGCPHLDQLIESLDGLWGWEFKLKDDAGSFNVVIRLDETNRECGEVVREQLQLLFDYLAIIRKVGFYIKQFSCQLRPRMELNAFPGPAEEMLSPVTSEEINNIKAILSSDKNMLAARGLNQSYIENCMPSRLSMLWAATEHVFRSKSEPLLTKDEINQILESAKNVESLKNDPDRLDKLKNAISDPSRVFLKSKNKIMAENMAQIMNISEESAYSNLRVISKLRGKNVHQLSDDWGALREAEKFLQEALLSYLKRRK